MNKILFFMVVFLVCASAGAVIVDLSVYFPQTLTPSCYRYEDWDGEVINDYQVHTYSTFVDGLDNDVAYEFIIDYFPVGDNIDNISNYYYEIGVGINWGESGIGYGDNASFCAPGRAHSLWGVSPLQARQRELLAGRQGLSP
jgi:hypothetical protein